MAARPKKRHPRQKALDRPFDKAILAKAKAIVEQYKIVLEFEDGDWYGHGLEIPTAYGDGKTVAAAVADTREGLITAVAYMLEKGQTPPEPAREGNRSAQVNVRLTPGFRGLSDFIRASVLAEK